MSRILLVLTYVAGTIGAAAGFYFLGGGQPIAAMIALVMAFDIVMGALSWVRHVLLWKSDAKGLGVEGSYDPIFQWEVGFANGAFALVGLATLVFNLGLEAMAATVFCYVLYLLQGSVLHGWRYFGGKNRSPQRLWGSFVGLGVLCLMNGYITIAALMSVR